VDEAVSHNYLSKSNDFFYYVKQNAAGQTINRWAPEDTSVLSEGLRYTVIGRRPIENPTNLQAAEIPNSDDIRLTWNDNSNNEAKFKIHRSTNGSTFPLYDSVSQNEIQYTDNNTTQGQKYWYRVQAWAQEFHSGYSNIDDAVAGLAAPSNLTLIEQSGMNTVEIQWYDNSLIEAGFQIARATDDVWKYDYANTSANITSYIDTVTFLHKYNYKIQAYDDYSHYSEWSNEVEFTPGMLVMSDYDKMSAYNNGAKIAKHGNNVYITYAEGDWDYREMHILHSTDGGSNFTEVYSDVSGWGYITNPAIAVSNDGTPYVTWGAIEYKTGKKGITGWFRSYWCAYSEYGFWEARRIIDEKIHGNEAWSPPPESLAAPSIALSSDSGYIAFKLRYPQNIRVARFLLTNPGLQHHEIILNTEWCEEYVPIGYDNAGRIVVAGYSDSYADLYYRSPGIESWDSYHLGDCDALGSPSLWTGTNEVKLTFEGCHGQDQGLIFVRFVWSSTPVGRGSYTPSSIEVVSSSFDYPTYPEGYSYLASNDVVLFRDDGDIWYSRRLFGEWTEPWNISKTVDRLSTYQHGVAFRTGLYYKLVTLWTEEREGSYYLVRDIIDLPWAYPYVDVALSNIPEATGYNNSQRLLRDANGVLHLAFTGSDKVFHTSLQDMAWTEPDLVGAGKYPSLLLGSDDMLYSIYAYNEGSHYFLEELRLSTFDNQDWSPPVPLMHTYDSNLWGVGAPSYASSDSMGYFIFETSYGPTYHPAPGIGPLPVVITLRGLALVYGRFPLSSPAECQWQILDSMPLHPVPVSYDTIQYAESIVASLVSPSITVDPAGIVHIIWEGVSDSLYCYRIEDTTIIKQVSPGLVTDYPLIIMREDQIDHFWCEQNQIKHQYT